MDQSALITSAAELHGDMLLARCRAFEQFITTLPDVNAGFKTAAMRGADFTWLRLSEEYVNIELEVKQFLLSYGYTVRQTTREEGSVSLCVHW